MGGGVLAGADAPPSGAELAATGDPRAGGRFSLLDLTVGKSCRGGDLARRAGSRRIGNSG